MRPMIPLLLVSLMAAPPVAVQAQSRPAAQDSVGRAFNRAGCTNGRPVTAAVRDANLRVVRSFVDRAIGRGDAKAFDELVAPDVWVSTGLKAGAPITSNTEWRDVLYGTFGKAISNPSLQVVESLATVDGRVIVRFVAQGDHTGEIEGVAPTNRHLTFGEIHLFCVRNGKIVENFVGGLNPLQWEMIYAGPITAKVFPDGQPAATRPAGQ